MSGGAGNFHSARAVGTEPMHLPPTYPIEEIRQFQSQNQSSSLPVEWLFATTNGGEISTGKSDSTTMNVAQLLLSLSSVATPLVRSVVGKAGTPVEHGSSWEAWVAATMLESTDHFRAMVSEI